MRTRKRQHRIIYILLSLLLLWTVLPAGVFAREKIDLEQKTSLTIQYPCAGTLFRIYRVADISEYGEYALTREFEEYAVDLNQSDQNGWRALASTLVGYVERDGKEAQDTKAADADGKAYFKDLSAGLYLVLGDQAEDDTFKYEAEASLIALPDLDENDQWVYDVAASPKYEKNPLKPDEDVTQKKVIKIWKDGNSKSRPKDIRVQLLKDGKVADTVTLNADNNWKYQWDNLDNSAAWQVVEQTVPSGYTVAVEKEADTFTIINTKNTGKTGGNTSTTKSTQSSMSKGSKSGKLPQTGQLWWPVGMLSVIGMLLFLIGYIRRKQ